VTQIELTEPELRERIEQLAALERVAGSDAEHAGARAIADELRELGAAVRIEPERVHGTYWWPVGIPAAIGALCGLSGGGRKAAAIAALAGASVAEDLRYGPRLLRRLLVRRTTHNVVAELGDRNAERTLVFVAHHDAPHEGFVFHPELARSLFRRFPQLLERAQTAPPVLWGAVIGPVLVALSSALGMRRLRRVGTALSAGYVAAMADIGLRATVPAANDNASGVAAMLSLARWLAAEPPPGLRVILLFPGSEESFSEGMQAFARRHFDELPRESTSFVCVDTVGSPHLLLLAGEGFLGISEYPKDFLAFASRCAQEAGVPIMHGLRFQNGTDGYISLKAGYPTVMLGSVDRFKVPTDYHWRTDTPDRIDYDSVQNAVKLCRRMVERVSSR